MTPAQEARTREHIAVIRALSEVHVAAIVSLERALPTRPQLAPMAAVFALEIAARMAEGIPVTTEAAQDVGRRYLDLIVELGKQVDARMSAEADRLSDDDLRLLNEGLSALTSDYNNAPHEAIEKLMQRIAAKVTP